MCGAQSIRRLHLQGNTAQLISPSDKAKSGKPASLVVLAARESWLHKKETAAVGMSFNLFRSKPRPQSIDLTIVKNTGGSREKLYILEPYSRSLSPNSSVYLLRHE